jgi:5-methylcytosine-specific restriction enzyme A
MIDIYIILCIVVLFIVYQCNLIPVNLISLNYITSINWMNLFKNLWFILPILTMYLEKDSITKLFYNSNNSKKSNKVLRSRLNETKKKVVASSQQWSCRYCKKLLDASYEIDHIIPLYKGGNNDLNNLQALCRNCHGQKTINDKLNV